MPELTCECGRLQSEATFVVQRGTLTRWTYFTCNCGRKWTVPEVAEDLAETITSGEIIKVHEALERSNLTVKEITE